jgi:hypothetical protein
MSKFSLKRPIPPECLRGLQIDEPSARNQAVTNWARPSKSVAQQRLPWFNFLSWANASRREKRRTNTAAYT